MSTERRYVNPKTGDHRFTPEKTNHGFYFSDCSCGWSGGVYPSRGAAKHAHTAHVKDRADVIERGES